ncbi:hypothetical protein GF314_08390 [bacterium]|nr:hypothetical protein [bacterium]
MMRADADGRSRPLWRGNPRLLLGALVLQIVLLPVAGWTDFPVARVLSTLTILGALDLACRNRRDMTIGLGLGIPAIVLTWVSTLPGTQSLHHVTYLFVIALYLFILNRMLRRVVGARIVDADTIVLAICSYLILGAVWALAYIPLVHYAPGSFVGLDGADTAARVDDLYYLSYVTLTTLGFGDITPATPLARALVVLESITGVLFTAVLIAMLMGKYTTRRS